VKCGSTAALLIRLSTSVISIILKIMQTSHRQLGFIASQYRQFQRIAAIRYGAGALLLIIFFVLGLCIGDGRIELHIGSAANVNNSLPQQLDYTTVDQIYRVLKVKYNGKLTAAQLVNGLKKGLAEATNDPYTEYFTTTEAKQFDNQLNNSFSGIGAALGANSDGNLIVISPIKGFPAEKAGLLPQDIIVSINGESTTGMAADIAVAKIRGPKGTSVTLKILRQRMQSITLTIIREDIQLPSVTSKILDGNIGYLQISSFSSDTAQLATQVASNFQKAHVNGVILDMRNNPVGLLDAAIDVSSLWLPADKTVVTEKGTQGSQLYTAKGGDILHGIPTIALINEGSASASEITASALHDNGAATLIGTKSYGKGVVQQIMQFSDGSELKVTVASWYRPNGQNITEKGITPDQTVSLSDADTKVGNDPQLAAAEAQLTHP
jgi:carboxyl-terminal processing protease